MTSNGDIPATGYVYRKKPSTCVGGVCSLPSDIPSFRDLSPVVSRKLSKIDLRRVDCESMIAKITLAGLVVHHFYVTLLENTKYMSKINASKDISYTRQYLVKMLAEAEVKAWQK